MWDNGIKSINKKIIMSNKKGKRNTFSHDSKSKGTGNIMTLLDLAKCR